MAQDIAVPSGAASAKAASDRTLAWAFAGCFFFSGCTGLVYQNVWVRILGLHFGNTAVAISAVLTAFMAGLALGSYIIGERADRLRHPLRAYAIIEILIGLYCVISPVLLTAARHAYFGFIRGGDSGVVARTLIQFTLCFVVLVIPTALMGATLPVLSAGLQRVMGTVAKTVGNLYAVNTFGAVAGTLLTAFFLLPTIGVQFTIYAGAIVNVSIGILLLIVGRKAPAPEPVADVTRVSIEEAEGDPGSSPDGAPPVAVAVRPSVIHRFMLWGFFVAGFCSLCSEVVWTRVLSMTIGSSVYAFAVILTAFLLGIALGSYLFALIWGKRPVGIHTFGLTEVLIGILCILLTQAFAWMPEVALSVLRGLKDSAPGALLAVQLIVAFLLVAPSTILMGIAFPLVTKILTDAGGPLGRSVGRAYAANTAGCILGSALSSLLLVPLLGMRVTILGAAVLYVLVGCGAFLIATERRALWRTWAGVSVAAAALLVAVLPSWSHSAFAFGVFQSNVVMGDDPAGGLAYARSNPERVKFYREGPSAVVSVVSWGDGKYALGVNGKTDASTSKGDMVTQVMTGHVPCLLAKELKRVVLVGCGSGISAACIARHPSVQSVECVEIEPNVGEAARQWFGDLNDHIFDREPRFKFHVDDGRSFIERVTEPYDVIISEPSNPWIAGVGNLYTVENYEYCRRALAEGGIMVQWTQIYSMGNDSLRMILNTFSSVFPHVAVFHTTSSDLLLVGSNEPLVLDRNKLQERLNALKDRADLAEFGCDTPEGFSSSYLLAGKDVQKLITKARKNTDDLPLLEFWAPRSLYSWTARENFQCLLAEQSSDLPPMQGFATRGPRGAHVRLLRGRSFRLRLENESGLARREFEKALELDPTSVPVLLELAQCAQDESRSVAALDYLDRALAIDPGEAEVHYRRALILADQGLTGNAIEALRLATALAPTNRDYQDKLDELREQSRR
ncbi:MAG TPA: fused MFS/spermidine synthase [Armatimonadota bacterium]|nr:fused MFS/spermidine synthase [Armatimonadota bacterium]